MKLIPYTRCTIILNADKRTIKNLNVFEIMSKIELLLTVIIYDLYLYFLKYT